MTPPITVIGGVLVSTFFTLLVVPCAYSLMANLESKSHPEAELYGEAAKPLMRPGHEHDDAPLLHGTRANGLTDERPTPHL